MRMQGVPAAILSTVVVAGLVTGIAIVTQKVAQGASAGATPSEASSPSEVPSPSPTVTASIPDDSGEPTVEEFCDLVDEMEAYEDEYGAHWVGPLIADFKSGEIPGDDPGLLEAIHAWGRYELDEIETRAGFAERAAGLVLDTNLVADFEHIAMETRLSDEKHGRAALEATSAEKYVEATTALLSDPELNAISAESVLVSERVGQYIYTTCGDVRFGGGDPQVDLADDDAQMIGAAIEEYLVGWEFGDPVPFITATNSSYYLNDVLIGVQSPYVTLLYQEFLDPMEWCIELASDTGGLPWSFSAQSGVQYGLCH